LVSKREGNDATNGGKRKGGRRKRHGAKFARRGYTRKGERKIQALQSIPQEGGTTSVKKKGEKIILSFLP